VPIILTGDLNACPTPVSKHFGFNSTVYPLIKRHPLRLRSVMNDDLVIPSDAEGPSIATEGRKPADRDDAIWTTWKARTKLGKELVVRHCIDYILYASARTRSSGAFKGEEGEGEVLPGRRIVVRALAALMMPRDEDVGPELLPNAAFPSDHIPLVADLQISEET
jgi:hypothetical protein